MTTNLFDLPGAFYRGNLHTHCTRSDGLLSAEEVCRRYQAQGYDFICMSDHFVGQYDYPITDTTAYRNNQFTTIIGAEVHSGAMENGELWHILAVGLPFDFSPSNSPDFRARTDQESGPEIARRAREAGAFVAIAHPQWSGMTLADAMSIDAAHAVEIYNHGSYVECDRGDGFSIADLMLSRGRRLSLCATDDAHFNGPDAFGGWVMVKAESRDPQQLLDALKAGHYYSSQGPDFHRIDWTGNSVEVRCSAVSRVAVQGAGVATVNVYGDSLSAATLSLDRMAGSNWLRVTIIDAAGRRAYSNPVWRTESGFSWS